MSTFVGDHLQSFASKRLERRQVLDLRIDFLVQERIVERHTQAFLLSDFTGHAVVQFVQEAVGFTVVVVAYCTADGLIKTGVNRGGEQQGFFASKHVGGCCIRALHFTGSLIGSGGFRGFG